ncbi:erythroblast NAD(P)(+)--arginine ADP-ribosyltransferase-like [Mauremys mutica]|uniref:erythroblast NAD(P)(+)--arginine ADP-ribosyltransferase-like n=1 Tax=Mauremys mutica TaxID=74926 RepID=UPI001D166C00|nr:erythroblast NAD(P)(+)--arginine ADP-ribosyltransferase-like [Mauremys mutica]XP_044872509.1 erythroblast NAD(P)(+)--arginine ADP-ribosyltransferase-like [Mauremys mutica]
MSPEKVALLLFTVAWALPAGTSGPHPDEIRTAGGNPTLTLASNSLDDIYRGCVKAMKRCLPSLLEEELEENQLFREAWDQAKEMWMQMENQTIFPKTLRALYSVAVLAYTLEEPSLYESFNVATRTAWKSPQAYASFAFKSLHFLLTQAAKKLGTKEPSCAKVYRGTKVKFSIEGLFRFGQFTSTSEKRQKAEEFGRTTFFVLLSCQGFPVGNLSRFPGEEEMVVPPYEMFRVTGVKETPRKKMVHAKSVGVCSNHNCAYLGREGNSTMSCPDHRVLYL